MILDNGTLQVQTTTGGGLVGGIPQEATLQWGDPIPCHIVANTYNQRGTFKDTTFTQSSYTVWFDYGLHIFNAKRVRLISGKGEQLGEFEVQSIEHADWVGRTKIMV